MDDLVRLLLDDLSHNLDRLADQLSVEKPALARAMRLESQRASPVRAREPVTRLRRRRAPLRPLLYRALEEGAISEPRFDRLMTMDSRAKR